MGRGRSLTQGEERRGRGLHGHGGWAGTSGGEEGPRLYSGKERPGARGGVHLKSLSLDVIFSRRLEMWKAAVLMVAARRGAGRREGIWRRGRPLPRQLRGLRSLDRNSSSCPAPCSRLGHGGCGRRAGLGLTRWSWPRPQSPPR